MIAIKHVFQASTEVYDISPTATVGYPENVVHGSRVGSSDQVRSAAVGAKQRWKMLQECIFENLEHELE